MVRIGWDIRHAWHTPNPDGGHRLVIALDRYMTMLEVSNQPRTVDDPFTLIEIHLNQAGRGLSSSEAVRLNSVEAEK